MVSVYPNPPGGHDQDFYNHGGDGIGDTMKMMGQLPGLHSLQPVVANTKFVNNLGSEGMGVDDQSKKVRKPYTITKSRESWTDQEHDKFLEGFALFDRDWKKIEAFVGSKTVIQIRSHAQKYFLKVQKSGASEHVPPPRPKRKAAHPYPQKAPKNAAHQVYEHLQSPLGEPKYAIRPDSSLVPRNSFSKADLSPWAYNSMPTAAMSNMEKDNIGLADSTIVKNYSSSSNESTPRFWPLNEANDQVKEKTKKSTRVMPDFSQVYSFIGSIFDHPNVGDHLQRLGKMDPINVETVLMLMRNLSVNLMSPDFEDQRRVIASYSVGREKDKENFPNASIKSVNLGNANVCM